MLIQKNLSSTSLNTFGINVNCAQVISIQKESDLNYLWPQLKAEKVRILGGGSNVLFTQEISEPVLSIDINGIEIIKEGEDYALVSVKAGEIWHNLVLWAISQDLGGIENLALIPGKCGAAPMQNIGAYGVELKDVLHSVRAFNLQDGNEYTFFHTECGLGYRTSHFKTTWKDKYVITEIILKLSKLGAHKLNTSYGAISAQLEEMGIKEPTIEDIAKTVISIRQKKLPNPEVIGNAGSFFKNPVVGKELFDSIFQKNPEMPHYPQETDEVKIPAGWLIEQCGWKGKVIGQTGTYKNQALVLVNHGHATGEEIYDLSSAIKDSVKQQFDIELEREVNVW